MVIRLCLVVHRESRELSIADIEREQSKVPFGLLEKNPLIRNKMKSLDLLMPFGFKSNALRHTKSQTFRMKRRSKSRAERKGKRVNSSTIRLKIPPSLWKMYFSY